MDQISLGIAWYLVFIFSTTAHEAAHAWAAKRGGDSTAYEGGQVGLNPVPHVRREPMGMVLVPIVSFALIGFMMGWASAPYDPTWARAHPHRAARMALAGPLANLVLFIGTGILIRFLIAGGALEFPDSVQFIRIVEGPGDGMMPAVATLLSLLFSLNLLLFVLNMIPLPPLDGSSGIGIFVSEENARRLQELMATPALSMFGMLGAFLMIQLIFWPLFLAAIRLLYPELGF